MDERLISGLETLRRYAFVRDRTTDGYSRNVIITDNEAAAIVNFIQSILVMADSIKEALGEEEN